MKSFLDACRLAEPLQLVVEAVGEPDVGVRFLHQPFALIGRDLRADVPLEHRLVSRRHAYLQVVEGHAFWIDLESRLGTQGGGRVRKSGWLTREEPMRIGPYELRRPISTRSPGGDGRPPEPSPLIARSYGNGVWPDVGLEFLNGPSRSAIWPMNRVISLVGSAGGCKFRLADPSVSPFHCSLVRTPSGLWVVDLLGGGGVEVNNAAVRYTPLADGDELTIGRYRIRIRSRFRDDDSEGIETDDDLEGSAERPVRALSLVRGAGLPATIHPQSEGPRPDRPGALQSVTVLPAELEARNLGESASVLVPLMNQFGMMQQQMMDQFQNAMGMLVEMFGSLQREQMDLIRQELDQLREVTREFQDLKSELAAFTREREAAAAVATPAQPVALNPAPATPEPVDRSPTPASPQSVTPPAAPVAAAQPAASETPGTRPPAGQVHGQAGGPSRPRRERPAKAEGGDAEADVMLWLNQRIATLQEERETRWQKILKLLPGSS